MKPLDIPCGVCGQAAGQPCVNLNGRSPRATGVHAVRRAAAKRGNRPPHTHA